jgi:hypothetical protein
MIQVDKEELRGIIREAVQKKLASLKESKGTAKPKATTPRKKSALTEAQKLEKARVALKMLQEAIGHTSHGSRLGPTDTGMKDEAVGGGVPGPIAGTPKMESGKPTVADTQAADELRLYMENDFGIWEGNQKKSIEKNLALKMKKGKYDAALAPKIWMYLVDGAAQKYVKEFGSGRDRVDSMFNKATRMQVASELAQEFEQAVESGEKDLESLIAAI